MILATITITELAGSKPRVCGDDPDATSVDSIMKK